MDGKAGNGLLSHLLLNRCVFYGIPIDFSVLEIVLSIMFAYFTQYLAGIAHGHNIRGQILCHNTACTYYRIIPDGNAGQDNRSGSDPAVSANPDRHIILIRFFPKLGQNRMSGGGNGNIGAEHGIIAYVDMGIVYTG